MSLNGSGELGDWDQGDPGGAPIPVRLEVRMVYWFPLRMPLIDWVLSRIVLAQWGLMAYTSVSPVRADARDGGELVAVHNEPIERRLPRKRPSRPRCLDDTI